MPNKYFLSTLVCNAKRFPNHIVIKGKMSGQSFEKHGIAELSAFNRVKPVNFNIQLEAHRKRLKIIKDSHLSLDQTNLTKKRILKA
jgi:hypothetical protein